MNRGKPTNVLCRNKNASGEDLLRAIDQSVLANGRILGTVINRDVAASGRDVMEDNADRFLRAASHKARNSAIRITPNANGRLPVESPESIVASIPRPARKESALQPPSVVIGLAQAYPPELVKPAPG